VPAGFLWESDEMLALKSPSELFNQFGGILNFINSL
jgi:hypothetical protein